MSDQENFDRFLTWLDPDRDKAGVKYENIRRKLVRIFIYNRCADVEELTDITIDRVIRKAPEIVESYVGDPALYFYGVARNVVMERCRPKPPPPVLPPPPEDSPEVKELKYECLEKCLNKLPPETRKMVLDYYKDDKTAKIERRKEMSERLGINKNALRIRMHRIREGLHKCVIECLKESITE
ncbi:MAG TPA: sigma-70 family RNA polymerase sigma factor [Blastocatellia bacterium]|nr:sigma-70 family RNA polymerase sigma factor [Blastocatellia bacterium]